MSIRCNFSLDSFTIMNTRSVHEDTDFVAASVAVADRPAVTATRAMGDLNNGTYGVGLAFENVEIGPGETAVFSYAIVNSGHEDPSWVEQQLLSAVKSLAEKGAQAAAAYAGGAIGAAVGAEIGTAAIPIIGTALGALAGWLVGELGSILLADCDGPVAAGFHVYGIDDIQQGTAGGAQSIVFNDDQPGVDSPCGCGSNSHYSVAGSVGLAGVSAGIDMPYSGVFAQTGDDYASCWGFARSDFDVFVQQQLAAGYMPLMFRCHRVPNFADGGWATVMHKNPDLPSFTWLYGYARADFDAKMAELYGLGYRAASITAQQGLTDSYWNAVVVADGTESPCVWDYKREDFDAKNMELQQAGLVLNWVQAYTGTDGEPHWIGIWQPDQQDLKWVYGWAREDFDKLVGDMQAQGYRLIMVNSFLGSDGGVYWNGIWKQDGTPWNAVWGWSREDFDNEVPKNGEAGLALVGLDC